MQALVIWVSLSLPSILGTLTLYAFPAEDEESKNPTGDSAEEEVEVTVAVSNVSYKCHENYTVYHPMYLEVRKRSNVYRRTTHTEGDFQQFTHALVLQKCIPKVFEILH